MSDFVHGVTTNGYNNRKCRCQPCRAAMAAYYKKRTAERGELIAKDPSLAPHGKETTYRNWACRCRPCRDAHADYNRGQYRKKRAS